MGERRRSAGEWSVLALLAEAPAHGWAVSLELGADGSVGAIWSLSRPLVYRSVELLEQDGLIELVGESASTRGPSRSLYRPTRKGRAALARWLDEPVHHVRDLRPDLLLKLVFLHRAGRDPSELLLAQRSVLEQFEDELNEKLAAATGEQAILLRYRVEVVRAALRFVVAEQLEPA